MTAPSDKDLWLNGCLTREQLRTWTDADLAKHSAGIRKTLVYLFSKLDEGREERQAER